MTEVGKPTARLRKRSHYFIPGDLVWIRPAGLPYWPAEVVESCERRNRVRARLLHPPAAPLLAANLAEEERWRAKECQQVGEINFKNQKSLPARCSEALPVEFNRSSPLCDAFTPKKTPASTHYIAQSEKSQKTRSLSCFGPPKEGISSSSDLPPARADEVTSSGNRIYFFSKLRSAAEVGACVTQRLRRTRADASPYQDDLKRAIEWANRLVRVVLEPEALLPYQVQAIGIVYSLLRTHTDAPRQPHTYEEDRKQMDEINPKANKQDSNGKEEENFGANNNKNPIPRTEAFLPQPAVIRLRAGLENAARDLDGFEWIWVLFQFSYAAAMGSGEGQRRIQRTRGEEEDAPTQPESVEMPFQRLGKLRRGGDGGKNFKHTTEQAEREEGEEEERFEDTAIDPHSMNKHDHLNNFNDNKDENNNNSNSNNNNNRNAKEEADAIEKEAEVVMEPPAAGWGRRQGLHRARGFKTMLIPPRDEVYRGVFATRSPHRPNFIGLSCVRLVAVHGLQIHIMDHDLLHGTPVLDIKPYLPFCDAHPGARAGWVDGVNARAGPRRGDHKPESHPVPLVRVFETPEEATS